ncbi:MAG: insulinase family protein [Propionibacteriaceae bacterium]|jgi:predicted Zn-dependent peptidase|nr:insulinase family protein [Propionibacteriaceae bacterium]
MRVIVNPDPCVPMVAISIWYDVGSRDELPGQTGWAHLFEHLMFQGSANVASGEHLNTLQSVGGSANATTSFDRTNYFETVPVGALELALWMEADRLATLPDHLTEEGIATQREVVKEERRQRYDNVPYGDAIEHLLELAFPEGHPYHHSVIGSMADVDSATAAAAAAFFREHYLPANAVISLVGDVTPEQGFELAERYFGGIPAADKPARAPSASLPPLADVPQKNLRRPVPADAVQYVFRLPVRDTRDFDAVTAVLSILGDGPSSRLERRLVRELEISAGVAGGVFDLIGGNSLGLVSAVALPGCPLSDLEERLDEVLVRFADEGPTEAELYRTKVRMEAEWLGALAQFETRADDFSEYATLFGDPEMVNRRLDQLLSMDADDLRRGAQLLLPDHRGVLRYLKEDDG